MIFVGRVQALLASALAISLTGKAASNQTVLSVNHTVVASRLESVLRTVGMEPSGRSPLAGGLAVSAKGAGCEVWAVEYSPYGTMADVIASEAQPVGSLRYVYHGRVYDQPPGLEPLLRFYWWRELKRIGIDAPRSPIIAVASSASCDLSAVPWERIDLLPG